MTSDDMMAYLANHRPKDRPTELRGNKRMLLVWIAMRDYPEFWEDVILRHGLDKIAAHELDKHDPTHGHAIGNAWGHCMQWIVENNYHKPTGNKES